MAGSRQRFAVIVAAVVLSIGGSTALTGDAEAHPLTTARGRALSTIADLPPGGRWVPYATTGAVRSVRGSGPPPQLVSPLVRPCRPGTTNYAGANRRFNCLGYYHDNANRGHPVLLRLGAAGDFGYLHGLIDHGLDEESIATVIVNNAAGRIQPNGRFLYGLRYEVGGVGLVAVEVYEQRTPDAVFRDGDGLGVVTAFCVGLDRCPDGINESLP